VRVHFLDGTEARAAELRRVAPTLDLDLVGLPAGFSTAAPDPAERARGMVLAADAIPCFAEAVDITTAEGASLRLELDSENDVRFCKWWRETPVRFHLCVAARLTAGAPVVLFRGVVDGHIADKPAGLRALGWDRLFVPAGFDHTLAELVVTPALGGSGVDPVGLRTQIYGELIAALTAVDAAPVALAPEV
jgi:hypothetical protein